MTNHLWGKEIILVNTELYCAKLIKLKRGYQSSLHCHKVKDETFYILNGRVRLETKNKTMILDKGDSLRLRPYKLHRFRTITKKATILEVSTHDEASDNIKMEPARRT